MAVKYKYQLEGSEIKIKIKKTKYYFDKSNNINKQKKFNKMYKAP